jgi:hypothetical protein
MNDPSPYQPPVSHEPPVMPALAVPEPATVKVFGILHLVFAGIGAIGALWGLFIALVGNPFLKMIPESQQVGAQMEAQLAMQEKVMPMTVISSALSLVVTAIMITAGIRLLKKRRSGLKWSNLYASSSLAAKGVNLILTLLIAVPATQEMSRRLMAEAGTPGSMESAMSGVMVGSMIFGVVITCVYPLLTLILLNRPTVKAWFATRQG